MGPFGCFVMSPTVKFAESFVRGWFLRPVFMCTIIYHLTTDYQTKRRAVKSMGRLFLMPSPFPPLCCTTCGPIVPSLVFAGAFGRGLGGQRCPIPKILTDVAQAGCRHGVVGPAESTPHKPMPSFRNLQSLELKRSLVAVQPD